MDQINPSSVIEAGTVIFMEKQRGRIAAALQLPEEARARVLHLLFSLAINDGYVLGVQSLADSLTTGDKPK